MILKTLPAMTFNSILKCANYTIVAHYYNLKDLLKEYNQRVLKSTIHGEC